MVVGWTLVGMVVVAGRTLQGCGCGASGTGSVVRGVGGGGCMFVAQDMHVLVCLLLMSHCQSQARNCCCGVCSLV